MAKNEVLDRELSTQKEIMKQFEISKKEYIAKLKGELDTVELRWLKVINENNMVGEDYRSQAYINFHKYLKLKVQSQQSVEIIENLQAEIDDLREKIKDLEIAADINEMEMEDKNAKVMQIDHELTEHKNVSQSYDDQAKADRNKIRGLETRVDTLESAVKGAQNKVEDLEKELEEVREWGENRFTAGKLKEKDPNSPSLVKPVVETEDMEAQTIIDMEKMDELED